MKKLVFFVIVSVIGISLTGCNTVKGFGEDVQKGGQVLQNVAK